VVASISIGVEINHSGSFKEISRMNPQKEEIMNNRSELKFTIIDY